MPTKSSESSHGSSAYTLGCRTGVDIAAETAPPNAARVLATNAAQRSGQCSLGESSSCVRMNASIVPHA